MGVDRIDADSVAGHRVAGLALRHVGLAQGMGRICLRIAVLMFIGFFFWYKGLALGGIARVGQVKLLQPFMTLVAAALLLGETLEWRTMLFALAIIAVVAVGRRMRSDAARLGDLLASKE